MVCDPSTNSINIPAPGPSPQLPGLGLPFSIPKIPFQDVKLPPGVPENIIDLIERIFALFPQGIKFQPNADALTKSIWDALASLFNQMAPFLGLYKFIQALLKIILCIIEVLCSLMNPWSTLRAIRRLFKQCLPEFLSLFPWIALLVMILALILLLIALIEYIIQVIRAYIKQIIENIKVLTRAIQVNDAESILAAVNKIAYLLCLIEQLFAILMALAALFAIVEPLMRMMGGSVCSKGGSSGCCTDDFCPQFIANEPLGMVSGTGRLIYQNKIQPIIPSDPMFDFLRLSPPNALRNERWQFVDTNPGDYRFLDIITPSIESGFIYWPDNEVFENTASLIRVPYLLDMNILIDPADFGNPSDTGGERLFSIQNIIVHQKPSTYPTSWNNGTEVTSPISGNLVLVGGLVYEFDSSTDGYSEYRINGEQATLETLVSRDVTYSNDFPATDDGYNFFDIQYNLRWSYEVLIDKKLINLMCQPDAAAESLVLNSEFSDFRSVFDKVGDLPNIGTLSSDRKDGTGTLGELARALTAFRENINDESAGVFQAEMERSLNALKAEAEDFYSRGAVAAADVFASDFSLTPDMQFIRSDINVTVVLKEKTGTQLGVGITEEIGAKLAAIITATPSLGTISAFEYDGYGSFTATLTSEVPGTGELRGFISGESLKEVIKRDEEGVPSEIRDRVLYYEFVGRTSITSREGRATRYGPPDVAEDGE